MAQKGFKKSGKQPVGRPKGSKSPKLKLKSKAEKKSIQKQVRFNPAENEIILKAAEIMGISASRLMREASLVKAEQMNDPSYRRRLKFLSEILEKNENDVIETAIYELYSTNLTLYIHGQAEVIRNTPSNERKPLIENLIKVLYEDLGNEKAVKEYLIHLKIPPLYSQTWRLPDVRGV